MNLPCSWPSPATHPDLGSGEAHAWFADLSQPAEVVRALGDVLSADERSRAGRFYFERDRRRYIVGRGLLRLILGRYLARDGRDLVFGYGAWGKPALASAQNDRELQFSLSHSADGVVYVFAAKRRVGIDVENMRPIPEAEDIIEQSFASEDSRNYHSLSTSQREEAFFRYWTRREALLKALGYGLGNAHLLREAVGDGIRPHQSPSGWLLHTFSPTHACIGAVAVEGDACRLNYFNANYRLLLCP